MTVDAKPTWATDERSTVDEENPWPGLVPFRETDRAFFRGRGREVQALARMVMRERLTVLFGTSGLGKSSLLQAGLFPALREKLVLPVYIRLDRSGEGPSPAAQIRQAIVRQTVAAGAQAPRLREGESLWENLHRRDADFWGPRNRPLLPLLVFDQFEELFTLGRRDAASLAASRELVDELAWLAEGSAPPELQSRLEENPEHARDYDFNRHHYKILLTVREDYLADLEELRGSIPSIARNRLRLRRMTGRAALRVVWLGAPRLIDLELAEPVVRFVSRAGPDESLDDVEVEPALLSVVCRKLNNKRRERGEEKITADLVAGSQESILEEFYENSIRDLGPKIRHFVEDRLLTVDDHRDSIAVGNALGLPGVTQQAIETLVNRRLARIEESAGSARLELTHDLLVGAIAASRKRRRRRRKRFWTWMLAAAAALLLVFALFGVQQLVRARHRAEDERRLRVAAEWAETDGERALAVLLELWNPAGRAADNPPALFTALVSAFGGSLEADFAEVVGLAPAPERAFFSPDGALLAAVTPNRPIRVHSVDGPGDAVELGGSEGPVLSAAFSHGGKRFGAGFGDGTTRVWSIDREDVATVLQGPAAPVLSVAFSHSGTRLVTGHGDGTARVWNADGSGEPVLLEGHVAPVQDVAFSPDDRRIVTASEDDTARVWDAAEGLPVRSLSSEDDVWSAAFSPDGRSIATASSDRLVRVWSADGAGEPIVLAGHEGPVVSALFTPSGTRIVSASVDGTARVWYADGYGRPVVLRNDDEPLLRAGFLGDDADARIRPSMFSGVVLTSSRTGRIRVWPAALGSIRELIRSRLSTCLSVEFREAELGETPREAKESFDRCSARLQTRGESR